MREKMLSRPTVSGKDAGGALSRLAAKKALYDLNTIYLVQENGQMPLGQWVDQP